MSRPWNNGIDLSQVRARVAQHAAAGLEEAAAVVLEASQATVPYEHRDLQKSGRSGLVDDRTSAVTYLDSKAVAVHEDLTAHRNHGRAAKFLEQALTTNRQRVLEILAREARRGLD